jgi:AcrR family transcriptional regulator
MAYHHGNLRAACVTEAMRQLERHGPDAVSLREVARRLGVSPRAPYRHFEDKTELLAAVAERGFEQFTRALQATRGFHALAEAYVAFSLANPNLVRLMFTDRERRFPTLEQKARASFALLEEQIGHVVPPRHRALAATTAWALVQGLADLLRRKQIPGVQRGLTRFAVDALLRGLKG